MGNHGESGGLLGPQLTGTKAPTRRNSHFFASFFTEGAEESFEGPNGESKRVNGARLERRIDEEGLFLLSGRSFSCGIIFLRVTCGSHSGDVLARTHDPPSCRAEQQQCRLARG